MARSHTKAIDILSSRDDAKVLIDLLDIASHACIKHAEEMSQCGAINAASLLLALGSRAYDMRERLSIALEGE